MTLRWFVSRTVRQANEMCQRVEKILNAQRDILAPQAIEAVRNSIQELRAAAATANAEAVEGRASDLETAVKKWIKPYPNASVRENVDVILVALVIALGIRTFFFQPMAIPTGSMQPTLYGVTHQDLRRDPNAKIPGTFVRIFNALARGIWYYQVTAEEDGVFQKFEQPKMVLPLVKSQGIKVGGRTYPIWFPPEDIEGRSGLRPGEKFRKGEDVMRLKVMSGDRLFVNRFSYNFSRPQRGDIVIFASHGLPELTQDTHYIKRLVGLPGETIKLLNNRHASINGHELDAATPHFENIYSFSGPPRESQYSGHVNSLVAQQSGHPIMATRFPDADAQYSIPPHHFFVMGDNTMNSYDSRYWGSFPQDHVVGKFSFVFWPISARFGWAVR